MVTNNKCSVLAKETPVCKFHNTLTVDHALHTEGLEVSQKKKDALKIVRAYAICSLAKSEQVSEYYQDVINYELFNMKDSAEIIKTNIDDQAKQDIELSKLISDVSKSLNDLQVKLHDANNAACTMRNCLQSILGFQDNAVPQQLKDVTDQAKELSRDGKKAAETMVNVAGIHTFSNLGTLQPFSSRLTEKLTSMLTLMDGFITIAKAQQEQAQAELLEVLRQLNAVVFGSFRTAAIVNAEKNTLHFICDEECETIEEMEKEICMVLGSNDEESDANESEKDYLQNDMD